MKLLLKVLGLINAFYLLFLHSTNTTCIGGSSCSDVLSSVYGSVFGIPLAAFGISLYAILLLLYLLNRQKEISDESFHYLNLAILLPATAIAIILIGVQAFQLNTWCLFCSLNSLIITILFVLEFKKYNANKKFSVDLSLSQWLSVVLIGVLPLVSHLDLFKSKPSSNVIATISGEEITIGQLKRSSLKNELMDLNREVFQLKKHFLNQKLLELVAKKNQMSVESYVRDNVVAKVMVSDAEIKTFYDKNIDQIPEGKTFNDVKPGIRKHLVRKKGNAKVMDHLVQLKERYNVKFLVPSPDKINVIQNQYIVFSKGPKDAPVKVIEFADLECGACEKAHRTMKSNLEKLGKKVYFEYRHFPLPNHRYSKIFAKASICAGKQDRFFEFIDLSYANQNKLGKIAPADFAEQLTLNKLEFETCLNGDFAQDALNQDIQEGNRIGVSSTPTFIINGHIFIGIPTVDDIIQLL